jgi:hypothetical protein
MLANFSEGIADFNGPCKEFTYKWESGMGDNTYFNINDFWSCGRDIIKLLGITIKGNGELINLIWLHAMQLLAVCCWGKHGS